MDSTHWYVSVDGYTVGPVSTELLMRGLEHGKVPLDALVCVAGAAEWQDVTRVPPFSYKLFGTDRSEPDFEDETDPDSERCRASTLDPFARARAVAPAIAQWSLASDRPVTVRQSSVAGDRPVDATSEAQTCDDGLDVDVLLDTFDDETKPRYFNWTRPISAYFQPVESIELPSDALLISSLLGTPAAVLIQDDAMWNLALCLAFGSKELADAVAGRFFEAVLGLAEPSKIEWMTRTLLGRGLVPSGIPRDAGQNGFAALVRQCPSELQDYLV